VARHRHAWTERHRRRRLKQSGWTAKVVFVTILYGREFVQESLALGDVSFVVKDFVVADLPPGFAASSPDTFVSPTVVR
jgi:hypothetical protein